MATFITHTGLALATEHEGDIYRVTLVGDRVKILYEGPDQMEQQRVYRDAKALYSNREKEAQET